MTARAFMVLIALVATSGAPRPAPAQPSEAVRALQEILSSAGLDKWNGQRLLFGDLRPPIIITPEKDSRLAALMDMARRKDVTFDAEEALFSADMVATGLWQAGFFLKTYGTALFLAEPYDAQRVPLVLVHGINGSPRDFVEMAQHFAATPYQPVAFFYPTGMPLAQASAQLAARLGEFLRRHPTEHFGVVGHSMGGLVVKGMLDRPDAAALLPAWRTFVSIASPWGGIEAAQHAPRLPRHPASWDDLAPGSSFLDTINRKRFPAPLAFYLFFGARSGSRMMSALGNNDGVLTLASVLDSPVGQHARDVFGFYADHTGLLSDPLVFRRLDLVLAAELDPTQAAELPRR